MKDTLRSRRVKDKEGDADGERESYREERKHSEQKVVEQKKKT